MQLRLRNNAYDDVTDFEICGFHRNIKRERNISRTKHFFFKQKNVLITRQG